MFHPETPPKMNQEGETTPYDSRTGGPGKALGPRMAPRRLKVVQVCPSVGLRGVGHATLEVNRGCVEDILEGGGSLAEEPGLSSGPFWADFRPDMDLRRLIGDAWRLDGVAEMD